MIVLTREAAKVQLKVQPKESAESLLHLLQLCTTLSVPGWQLVEIVGGFPELCTVAVACQLHRVHVPGVSGAPAQGA